MFGVGTLVGVSVGMMAVGMAVDVSMGVGVDGEQPITTKIKEHPAMRIFLMTVTPLRLVSPFL